MATVKLNPKTTYSPRVLEKDIQKSILDYFAYKKIFHWRNNTGAFVRDDHFYRFGTPGSADIFALKDGKFYAIECKTNIGKLNKKQKEFLDNVTRTGGHAIIARSVRDVEFI